MAHHRDFHAQSPLIHHHDGRASSHRHNHHEEYAMVYEDYIEDKIDVIIDALAREYPNIIHKRLIISSITKATRDI